MAMIIDMFSGTGELGRAVAAGIDEPTQILSLSDNYRPARKYLKHHFPGTEVHKDFRDQVVPQNSIVTARTPWACRSPRSAVSLAMQSSAFRAALCSNADSPRSMTRKETSDMRHAAPRRRGKIPARLLAAAIVYGASLLLVTGITIIGALGVWALWGILGVR